MKIDVAIAAGQTIEYNEEGDFFRILSAPDPLTVRYYYQGREISEAEGVSQGYAEQFNTKHFDRIQVYSATAQSISFVMRLGNKVYFDKSPTGAVTLSGEQGPYTQAAGSVLAAGSSQLLAANTKRRYLLIQNNDANGILYLGLDGNPATVAGGVRVEPGFAYESGRYCPSGAITGIGNIDNANLVIVEG